MSDPLKRTIYDKFGITFDHKVKSYDDLINIQNILLNNEIHFVLQLTFLYVALVIVLYKFFDYYVNISFAIGLVFIKVDFNQTFYSLYIIYIQPIDTCDPFDFLFPYFSIHEKKILIEIIVMPVFVFLINLNDSNLYNEGKID